MATALPHVMTMATARPPHVPMANRADREAAPVNRENKEVDKEEVDREEADREEADREEVNNAVAREVGRVGEQHSPQPHRSPAILILSRGSC